ncbi:MAG TPA: bifunctional folylpolyglutamate synthase/dihydrofolate synthase, partial [Actinobacteria bacterium]|nr:bifunctional folylpolyglutamate synthase/dihydrofolate synthase [Actinomycetota bacterium]
EGVADVRSPGRIEVIGRDPLVLVDGAHNEQAMRALAETIVEEFADYRWNLVIGILDDKDVTAMLAHLDGLIGTAIVTAADSPRATDPQLLADSVRRVLTEADEVIVVPVVGQAVAEALAITERDGALLVTGSLYVIGEARPRLMSLT